MKNKRHNKIQYLLIAFLTVSTISLSWLSYTTKRDLDIVSEFVLYNNTMVNMMMGIPEGDGGI